MKLNEGVSIDTLGTGIMRRLTNHSGQYFDRSLKWAIQCSEFPFEPVLKSKCETILMNMTLICMKMKLHAELIFI